MNILNLIGKMWTAGCEKYDINSNTGNDGLNMDHLNSNTYEAERYFCRNKS